MYRTYTVTSMSRPPSSRKSTQLDDHPASDSAAAETNSESKYNQHDHNLRHNPKRADKFSQREKVLSSRTVSLRSGSKESKDKHSNDRRTRSSQRSAPRAPPSLGKRVTAAAITSPSFDNSEFTASLATKLLSTSIQGVLDFREARTLQLSASVGGCRLVQLIIQISWLLLYNKTIAICTRLYGPSGISRTC